DEVFGELILARRGEPCEREKNAEKQRLMQQVDRQTVAAEPTDGARGARALIARRGNGPERAQGARESRESDAGEQGPRPGQERPIVIGRRLDRGEADPAQPGSVECRRRKEARREKGRGCGDKSGWPRKKEKGRGKKARRSDAMQYAEEHERLRKDEIGAKRDERGGGGEAREAPPERPKASIALMREDEAHTGDEEKGKRDRVAEALEPPRIGQVRINIVEIAEVPDEVIGDHRDDGEAARRVEQDEPSRRRLGHFATGAAA